ncbi:transposase family protein [Streptomyces sp. NPDC002767]
MQTDPSFWEALVFDGIDDVDVETVTAAFGTVEVVARGRAAGAACPDCGWFSDRVHDRYPRRLKDLPLAEQGFVIRLTVRRFICGAAGCPRRTFAEPFSRLAAPHAGFTTRLNNAPVTYQMVRTYIAGLRGAPAGTPPRPPSVRQVTGWPTRHPTTLTEEDRAGLKEVLTRCPQLEEAAEHVRDLGEILTDRLGSTLPTWIDAVDASQLPGLTGFALHLLRDVDAVTAGLTLSWSSGSIEGAVNRIKKIKRQLYGRAGFELLRKMILLQ